MKDLSVQGCTEGIEGTEGCTGDLSVQGCHGALTGDTVQKSNQIIRWVLGDGKSGVPHG